MLNVALRMCNVQIDKKLLQLVLMLVDELEEKRLGTTIVDILTIKNKWNEKIRNTTND